LRKKRAIGYPLNTRSHKVEDACEVLDGLRQEFGGRINIPTVIPASLSKYHTYSNPGSSIPEGTEEEQTALLEDIKIFNNKIKESNLQSSVTTVNLSSRFFNFSIKKNRKSKAKTKRRVEKFTDSQLYDGLHLSHEIRPVCFKLIFDSAKRDLQKLSQGPIESSDDSASENDWDYKRAPHAAST
jgi:hypothetical protein